MAVPPAYLEGELMMRSTMLLLAGVLVAFGADYTGTWKLNTAKSKATGIQVPKQQTVVYKANGGGYDYSGSGTSATGEPIKTHFAYSKVGEEAKTTGFPNWDSIHVKTADEIDLKRGGKVVGTVVRAVSKDGKTMTLKGKLTLPDGKTGTYDYVYEKQ
jgi:hypothetical protein